MKKFHSIDLKEVMTIFSSSSTKFKSLLLLLMASFISISVLIFGIYAPFFWIAMLILLISYEDIIFQFIIINYQFLTPPLMTKPRSQSSVNELLNRFILSDMRFNHPDIVFKVNDKIENSAMRTYILNGINYIEIDYLALKVFSKEEFQAVIYHELGHIALRHLDKFKMVIFLGCASYIFLPILLPLFWLIGSYISRYHELEADKYSMKHDPNHYILKAEEAIEIDKTKVDFWKSLWHGFLYVTVAPNPSSASKIRSLRRVKTS